MWTPIGSRFSIEQTTTALPARVTHHLELVLLPAVQVLLDEHLVHGARVEAVLDHGRELLARPGDAAAGAAEGEGRPHDRRDREVDVGRVGDNRPRRRDADAVHGRTEELAVLRALDRAEVGADQLDAERIGSSTARFSAVWPPSVGRIASGFSRSITCATVSGSSGSR